MMKKLLVAVGFAVASFGAHADVVSGNLTLTNVGNTVLGKAFDPSAVNGGPAIATVAAGTSVLTGKLTANVYGIFTATFIGKEASFKNFYLDSDDSISGSYGNVGHTASTTVNAGSTIAFSFKDQNGSVFSNGQANSSVRGIAYFLNTFGLKDANNKLYDFLIGYNDSYKGHADFDDFVVGASLVATPLPAALPLMATAMGAFGLSRRKSKVAV